VAPAPRSDQFGRYRLIDELGTGGMSTVHLAEVHDKDGVSKMVALKRLLPAVAARPELRESFVREASLMRYLAHPNIPATFESGKINGVYFIAMEFVPGPTLKELVEHCGKTVGTVPIEITLNIVAQICDALDHAHKLCDEQGKPLGIVHRDISPANIILSESGLVKVIDFGLAKAAISSVETGKGIIKGKFNYVAPEYLGGELDARVDIWALGVVMYELLTSRRLFDGVDEFETIARVRKLPIPRPSLANPRVPPRLDEIVISALERDPRRRWQTAGDLRTALRGVIEEPGNQVDNRHVIDWVNWVLSQKPGTEASGVSKLISMKSPVPTETETADDDKSRSGETGWFRNLFGPRTRR
jgi:eukaryotic-like serine/threonine-protein kinase